MKLDRLMGIVTILLQRGTVTAPWLAQRFEVSRRTISRDIDALCRAGIPVVTRQGGHGGIGLAEGFKLDKSVLTHEELAELVAALKGMGSVGEAAQTTRLLDRLGTHGEAVVSLRESVVIDLASHYKDSLTPKIKQIKQAVRQCRVVEFDYYYEKGETHRRVEPYFVVFHWTAWYLFGFCQTRQDWRLFKLNRLWNLQLAQECYTPRDIPPEKRDFEARLPDEHQLVALFRPEERYRLIDSYGPHCYTQTEEGLLRLEIGYSNQAHILQWLLGFGAAVTVQRPAHLAKAVRETAREMLKNYPADG